MYFAVLRGPPAPEAPDGIVLRLDLRQELREGPATDGFTRAVLGETAPTLGQVIDAIDRAAEDPRVRGLVAVLDGDVFGPATAQELHAAIMRFRDSGRFTLAQASSFGETGPGDWPYYIATACEEILLQPVGILGLTGLRAEVPFAEQVLSEIGLNAEFVRRGPYKTLPESLTQRDFSPEHREMIQSLVGDLYEQLVTGIAEGRGLPPAEVRQIIDSGPYTAPGALDLGLVDAVGHRQDVEQMALERAGEQAGLIDPVQYLDLTGAPDEPAGRVALIYAIGTIVPGESEAPPFIAGALMGADTIAGALEDAAARDDIDAIVLRIDSGGGSATASETIARAVRQAEEAGKPVIVSMGTAAASGGYWIAADAREIVALPATLTGSIGVFAGKVVTEDLWDNIGVNWGVVERGANAGIWSSLSPYSESGAARVTEVVDHIYEQFIEHVAEGRGLSPDAVQSIAEGRVWTGAQARELGLVDRLGGLETAMAAAREAAGLAPEPPLDLVVLPEAPSALQQLLRLTSGARTGTESLALLHRLAPLLHQLDPLAADRGLLQMPETGLHR
jgi:protease-4